MNGFLEVPFKKDLYFSPAKDLDVRLPLYASLVGLLLWTCSDEDTTIPAQDQLAIDIGIIEDYLEERDITAEKTASGLHYRILEEGDGTHPGANSVVEVKYRGYLTTGAVFDKTADATTIKFDLNRTIPGWIEGIPLIESGGGKGQLFLPSALGYGSNPPFGSIIPENAVLIFDVTLVDFE